MYYIAIILTLWQLVNGQIEVPPTNVEQQSSQLSVNLTQPSTETNQQEVKDNALHQDDAEDNDSLDNNSNTSNNRIHLYQENANRKYLKGEMKEFFALVEFEERFCFIF